jgi:hypothetical protein
LHLNEAEKAENLRKVQGSCGELALGVKLSHKSLNALASGVLRLSAGLTGLCNSSADSVTLGILKERLIKACRARGEIMNQSWLNIESLSQTGQREYAAHAFLTAFPVAAIGGIELKNIADLLIVHFLVATLVSHHLLAKLEQLNRIWEFYRFRTFHGLSPSVRCEYADPCKICERGSQSLILNSLVCFKYIWSLVFLSRNWPAIISQNDLARVLRHARPQTIVKQGIAVTGRNIPIAL